MQNTLMKWTYHLLALLAGGTLAFAFAPFNYVSLSIISPALLLALCIDATPKQAFFRGLLFGLGLFGIGASWVFVSIHTYGNANIVFSTLITALLVFILALMPACKMGLLTKLFKRSTLIKCLVAFPAIWVLFDWVISWFLSGFPWLFLGYSQLHTPLHNLAPLTSVYGVTFAVALTSGALVSIFLIPRLRSIILTLVITAAVWGISAALSPVQWTHPTGKPIPVSLVQGNIPQEMKWDPKQYVQTLAAYKQLSSEHWNSKLIIWPEAAIPVFQTQASAYLDMMNKQAKLHHTTIITGVPIALQDEFYNGALALGDGKGMYLKRHLVPFGEYLPFRHFLEWFRYFVQIPMSDFASGPKKQKAIQADGLTIATFLCYEVAFPKEVLNEMPAAKLLVVLTDDSWFGKSIASAQQLQISQMRALEAGRYMLVATNNGITAIINPQGQIIKQAPKFIRTVLSGEVYAMTGATPIVVCGIYPFLLLCFLLLMFGLILDRRLHKRRSL